MPRGNGKLKDIDKFDNEFFGVNPKQANVMDPQLRILHEVAYEALVDAGKTLSISIIHIVFVFTSPLSSFFFSVLC